MATTWDWPKSDLLVFELTEEVKMSEVLLNGHSMGKSESLSFCVYQNGVVMRLEKGSQKNYIKMKKLRNEGEYGHGFKGLLLNEGKSV